MVKPEDVVKLLAMDCAYEHAEAVQRLIQQRAELLEALKGMKDAFCNPESGEMDKRLAVQDMNIAITKAEAEE